jgi:hypothetical protein
MLLPALLLGALLALGAFSAACTGDDNDDNGSETPEATETAEAGGDDPTDEPADDTSEPSSELEEYFQGLDAAENDLRSGADSADEALTALNDSTPPDEVIAAFEDAQAVVDEFAADLEALDPPPETAVAHEETVAAWQAVSGIISDAIDLVEGGGTLQEAADVLTSQEATEVDAATDALCSALQQIATDNGIDVDLGC